MAELATTYAVALIRMHHALAPLRIPAPAGRTRTPTEESEAELTAEMMVRIIDDVFASLELTNDQNDQVDRARAILAEGLQRESDERRASGGWWP